MFKITDEMKKRCEENKEWLESQFIDTKRTYWVAFCDKFYRECETEEFLDYIEDLENKIINLNEKFKK